MGGGQAGRHLRDRDHPLAEAVERDRVPRRGDRPGPAAAVRPGPPGPGAPALVGQPPADLGTAGGRASRRAGGGGIPAGADSAADGRRPRPGGQGTGRRAARRHRGRLHAHVPAVRPRTGLGTAPLVGGARRRGGRRLRRGGARLRVGRRAHFPHARPPPGQGRSRHVLPADLGHLPAPAAAGDVGPGRYRVPGPGRADAVAPAGRGAGTARDPAGAGLHRRLAVPLVLPAALVQHDGHRRAGGLLGLPPRLGGGRPAHRRDRRDHAGHRAGHTPALAGPALVSALVPADAAGPVRLPRVPGLALRHQGLEPRSPRGPGRSGSARTHDGAAPERVTAPAAPGTSSGPGRRRYSGTVLPVIRDRTLVAKGGHRPQISNRDGQTQ